MASPQEKLAESLQVLRELQERGAIAVRSADLSRTHRERLVKNGFLKVVMRGWYTPSRPGETPGDSTAWYASFWEFCASYLKERFDSDWCLSPQRSLFLHTGNRTVPKQLLVRSPKGGNKPTTLPFGTSLFDVRYTMPKKDEIVEKDGLRLYTVPAALVACPEQFFRHASTEMRAAMAMVKDASDVLVLLLEGGHDRIADQIIATMKTAGFTMLESDPFENRPPQILDKREASPYVNRIRQMWQKMREPIIERLPATPGLPEDIYIHPYVDGNGRMGRFLMNTMLASGGYPWTVIPVDERDAYMAALEVASVDQNIGPFTDFLAELVSAGLEGTVTTKLPPSN